MLDERSFNEMKLLKRNNIIQSTLDENCLPYQMFMLWHNRLTTTTSLKGNWNDKDQPFDITNVDV